MMVLPQDCFEVCNDYECLYLCPQPLRGVKRCITPLKSNKKNCCQNGQNISSTGTDNLKTAGKHIWQARDQLLGIKKEIENDLANRRYSLLKGLQPFSLRQHNKEPLFKLGTKTSKPKSNPVKLVCPVNDKKVTNAPNNFVNTNNGILGGGAGYNSENYIPQTLPYYENNLSKEKETVQFSDYNDEILSSTTTIPMLRNENIEDIREQVIAPKSNSDPEGKEEMQKIFTDVSGNKDILESEQATYDTDFPKSSSNSNDCNGPGAEQTRNEHFLNQPSTSLSSDSGQPTNYNYKVTSEMSDPVTFYVDPYRGNPMESENSVLSPTNRNDFLFTTPLIHEISSSDVRKSSADTEDNNKTGNITTEEISENPVKKFQNPLLAASGTIENKQSETDQNILDESNKQVLGDNKNYAYTEGEEIFSSLPKDSNVSNIANIVESASSKTHVVDEKTSSDNLEQVFLESYLRSEDGEHQSLPPNELSKSDINFFISNETGVRNEINKLNSSESESNGFIERSEMEGSTKKLDDTEHSDDYPNDDTSSSNANEMNRSTSKMNFSSGRDVFEGDDKKSLFEVLKQSASCNNQTQNYTCRILQELISKYNITNDIKNVGSNAPDGIPLNTLADHETSKHYLTQKKTIINSNPTDQNSDILQSDSNENESYFLINNTKHTPYSSKSPNSPTNIHTSKLLSKLDVENYMKGESIHELINPSEINDQHVLNGPNNDSTRDIQISEKMPVDSYSNISKSFRPNDESEWSNITYPSENATSGALGLIPSMTKDNINDMISGDIVNKTASKNILVINPSHSLVSRAEQVTTAASVYFVQKGSLENSSHVNDSQFAFHPDQDKTIIQLKTNPTDEKLENKNTNITENQFDVESSIEEPIVKNNFLTSNESTTHVNNSNIVDQELFYDAGDSESVNINTPRDDHIANISVHGTIYEKLNNETDGSDLYDQNEKVLQLIPNVSDIPLATTFDDKTTETKNDGIEDVYLKLEESNDNSSISIENDNNYEDLYRSKYPSEISTELNDSEYTLKDSKGNSIINKKKLSDVINTELNSLKQPNVVLKKREEEEEVSYDDDPQCDCSYPTSRDDDVDRYISTGPYFDRTNNFPHPVYPMFIVVPIPYPVCDCKNKTTYNNINNNYINTPVPYVYREHSELQPDYSFNSFYNNFQGEREGKAVQTPPYIPNFFFPFVPWGGMYNMFNPYHQPVEYENDLQGRDATNENLSYKVYNDNQSTGEGLENPNQGDMVEFQQESDSASKSPETQRFLRNEYKGTETMEYVFVDGQYVKVLKNDKNERNGDEYKTEETLTALTEPSIDTSTTALYISTTQQPLPVDKAVTTVPMDTNENAYRPVNFFHPSDFGSAKNPYYRYFPGYFFTHHR